MNNIKINNTPDKPVLVIVHGAWGGSWTWRQAASMLTQKGYTVYRPSLTGLGERMHLATPDVGLSTHINDIVNVFIFEDLHNVILIGHSYGGMVVTGVADKIPDRIQRLIYIDAFLPENGESIESIQKSRGKWDKYKLEGGFLIPSWVTPDQPIPKDVPQSAKTFTEPIILKNKSARKLPAAYILMVQPNHIANENDFVFHAERAKKRGWPIYKLESDHNPQRTAPEALVKMLDCIATCRTVPQTTK